MASYLFEQSIQELFKGVVPEEQLASFTPNNPLLKNLPKAILIEKDIENDANFNNAPFHKLLKDAQDIFSVASVITPNNYILDIWKSSTTSTEIDESANSQEINWENRFNLQKNVPDCLQSPIFEKLFDEMGIVLFNPAKAVKTAKITSDDGEENYCVEMRDLQLNLLTQMTKNLQTADQLEIFITIIYDVIDLLSIYEALNIITGDLSLNNLTVSFDENEAPTVLLQRMHKMKFLTFIQDDDPVLRYSGKHMPPEIRKRTIAEGKNQGTVDRINQYGWDYKGYIYTLKEDNYAFGMILQTINEFNVESLSQNERYKNFKVLLSYLIGKLTTEDPISRITFREAATIFESVFEQEYTMYGYFIEENQELANSENLRRKEKYTLLWITKPVFEII